MIPLPYLILQMVHAAVLGKKMILKKRGNKYFLAQSPTINKNRKPTIAREKHMNKFSAAVSYASAAMANPELKELYRATKNRSKFNNAVRDYMRPPEVRAIDASDYNGKAGQTIWISANDDFKVTSVKVNIYNFQGILLEEGKAVSINGNNWHYTTTKNAGLRSGCRIRAVAQDLPKNTGELEVILKRSMTSDYCSWIKNNPAQSDIKRNEEPSTNKNSHIQGITNQKLFQYSGIGLNVANPSR
jgi:hypothetical protein